MKSDAGFTLVETLVGVIVLGFVYAGLAQATRFGFHAWDVQARLATRAYDMARVDDILRLVVAEASPPRAAGDHPFSGEEHRLVFITRLPIQPPTDPVRCAQVAIGVDARHRLLLRWQPHPNAVSLRPLPPPAEIVLVEGVDHFDVIYRESHSDGGNWMMRWERALLPALVQMHVVMQNKKFDWPALQAATMIDVTGSL